jgi:hypothetical protein
MAQDESRREQQRDRDARGPEWRGDEGFGGGWGNQVPRPQPSHDRSDRILGGDRQYYDERSDYSPAGDWYGPDTAYGERQFGGPGLDAGRPRRAEFARARGPARPGDFIGADTRFGISRDFPPDYRTAHRHDPHYAEWRNRQIAEFDRDYDEYRSENQSRFDREFSEWRQRRGEQRAALGRVREHMEVTGSDGGHVGTVDCTRGDNIVLTRSDEAAGGVHHKIPCAWIANVDDKVVQTIEAGEARRRWQTADRSRALFEREHVGTPGPHVLNRSFAGTYPDEK